MTVTLGSVSTEPWEEHWVCDHRIVKGGQSVSYVVTAKDGSGRRAFIKTLKRPLERKPRARFHREATAYETLEGLGPPRLYDHNAHLWKKRNTPLYMALEYVEGDDLQTVMAEDGPLDVAAAFSCITELAVVLHRCHENGLVHRDIKPANIVLSKRMPTAPVLVDFGLSFNDVDQDGLTNVNEEVGNRFLRLPEHALGGRTRTSDVTQLAGVFVYLLTGVEPRVLIDHAGLPPHYRPDVREKLTELFSRRQLIRMLSVFDRAFNSEVAKRYQTSLELVAALELAMRSDQEGDDDLASLLAEVDETALSEHQALLGRRHAALSQFLSVIRAGFQDFAQGRNLQQVWTGRVIPQAADEALCKARMAFDQYGQEPNWIDFRVEPRDPDEYVVILDGQEVWRGLAPDESLNDLVMRAAAKNYLGR